MQTPRPARRTAGAGWDGKPETVRLPGRFEYFYLQEYPKVVALAYALSGSRAGAEDIAQEAFLRAYRDWDRVGSYEHQAAWVRRVAANLATAGPGRPPRWPPPRRWSWSFGWASGDPSRPCP
jgi:Sigma-70 region 2